MANEAKIYCGDRSNLPGGQGYSRFGTRNECLKCGFGAAMYKYRWEPADNQPRPPPRAQRGCLRPRRHEQGAVRGNQFSQNARLRRRPSLSPMRANPRGNLVMAIAVWVVASVASFLVLYKVPPSVVTEMKHGKRVINRGKFLAMYVVIISVITAVVIGGYYLL